MDFINKWLAELLAKFKANSPTLFMILAVVLSSIKGLIDSGMINLPGGIIDWVLWFIALFMGVRTTRFITEEK